MLFISAITVQNITITMLMLISVKCQRQLGRVRLAYSQKRGFGLVTAEWKLTSFGTRRLRNCPSASVVDIIRPNCIVVDTISPQIHMKCAREELCQPQFLNGGNVLKPQFLNEGGFPNQKY